MQLLTGPLRGVIILRICRAIVVAIIAIIIVIIIATENCPVLANK